MVSTAKLLRDYRCAKCHSRLTEKYIDEEWKVVCCACGVTKFIHERKAQQERMEAREVLDGLPANLQQAMGYTPKPSKPLVIFSLSPPEVEI